MKDLQEDEHKMTDMLFISGLDFSEADSYLPQHGQAILEQLLKPVCSTYLLNFDMEVRLGRFAYAEDYMVMLDEMTEYILSFKPRMQKLIHKNLKMDDVLKLIILMKKSGYRVMTSFIYGFAEETVEDFGMTLDMAQKLLEVGVDEIQLDKFFPLPATEEAGKVKDILYFDENEIDTSIVYRKSLVPETLTMIREHPALFSQYYTFRSEVRQKFKWADSLCGFAGLITKRHRWTFRLLLKRYGLMNLYLRHEDIFRELSVIYGALEYPWPDEKLEELLSRMLEREALSAAWELFHYEKDLMAYKEENTREMRILSYQLDIPAAIGRGEHVEKSCRIALKREKESDGIRMIPLPEWIEL